MFVVCYEMMKLFKGKFVVGFGFVNDIGFFIFYVNFEGKICLNFYVLFCLNGINM